MIPSKYNPSKELDFKGVKLRYEDNGDAVNNIVVIKLPSGKGSIESYGTQDAFLQEISNFGLLGKQAYTGVHHSLPHRHTSGLPGLLQQLYEH